MDSQKEINKIASRIKKILKEQGTYFPGLDFMIEIMAGNMYAYYKIIKDVKDLSTTDVVEITREGNPKKRVHPLFRELREQSEEVRRCLRELKLTISTVDGIADDDMGDLIDSVNSIE